MYFEYCDNNNIVKDSNGKIPPQAIEVEESVLGQLMIDQYAFDEVSELIKPEIFYKEHHRYICESICNLNKKNIEIDILSVANDLMESGKLEIIGGPFAISNLTQKVSSAANIEFHTKILVDRFKRRELIRLTNIHQEKAFDLEIDTNDLIDKFQSDTLKLTSEFDTNKESQIGEVLRQFDNEINSSSEPTSYIKSPFREINECSNGYGFGDFIVRAARPSMGKTALTLYELYQMAKSGIPVAFFSLEMKKMKLLLRIISIETGIAIKKLEKANRKTNPGALNVEEWKMYDKAYAIIENIPLYIDDTPAISYITLRSKLRKLVKNKGVKLAAIDYLQLMTSDDLKDNDVTRIGKISRNCKQIALDLNMPLLALSQLNRAIEDRPKLQQTGRLSDLRGAGDIEQDADVVMFWVNFDILEVKDFYGDDVTNKGLLDIQKNRNGKTKGFYLNVSNDKMRYSDNELRPEDFNRNIDDLPF